MKKYIICLAIGLVAAGAAKAQNLNPTVEVTQDYAREASGIEKPSQLLSLPDSLTRFNLDFDYSVQSTPYKGSYEFKPYLVQFAPEDRFTGERSLYLRAGAGYSLHPEVDIVWTPLKKDNFRLNLYGSHRSYFGKYRNIVLDADSKFTADGTTYNGSRTNSAVGADFLLAWNGGTFTGGLNYRGVSGNDYAMSTMHNLVQFDARIKSNPSTRFFYEAGAHLNYLSQPLFKEFHTKFDAAVGMNFSHNFLRLGFFGETVNQVEGFAGAFSIVPKYIISAGRFRAALGLKFSFIARNNENFCPSKSGFIFPDANVSVLLVPEALLLYASATGGDNLQSYESLLERNPFLGSATYALDNSVTRVDMALGLKGNIAGRFAYNLRGGYKLVSNAFTWGWKDYDPVVGGLPIYVGYLGSQDPDNKGNLSTFYVAFDGGFRSESLDIGGDIYYGHTIVPELVTDYDQRLFAPTPFRAHAHAYYIWKGRLKAGVNFSTTSGQKSRLGTLPGYFDLGLGAQFNLTSKLGFWLKAGNLIGQTVQEIPFHAEKGIYFTVGVEINL